MKHINTEQNEATTARHLYVLCDYTFDSFAKQLKTEFLRTLFERTPN